MATDIQNVMSSLPVEVVTALAICGENLRKGCYWGVVDKDDWLDYEQEVRENGQQPDLLTPTYLVGNKVLLEANPSLLLGGISLIPEIDTDEISASMEELSNNARKTLCTRMLSTFKHFIDTGQVSKKIRFGMYSNNLGDYLTYGRGEKEIRLFGYQCTLVDVIEVLKYVQDYYQSFTVNAGFELLDGSVVALDEVLGYLDYNQGNGLKIAATNGDNGVIGMLVLTRG